MKVTKFGGSSVSNAEQIKKVLDIVNSDEARKIVVVSAPGKRNKDDVKTTDLLIRLYEKVIERLDYTSKKEEIIQRYKDIINELNMSDTLLKTIDETLENYIATLRKNHQDYLMLYFHVARILMLKLLQNIITAKALQRATFHLEKLVLPLQIYLKMRKS